MLKDKERCETVIHNAYEKAFSLYGKFYIATNYIKSKQTYIIFMRNDKGCNTYFDVDLKKFTRYQSMYNYILNNFYEYIKEVLIQCGK